MQDQGLAALARDIEEADEVPAALADRTRALLAPRGVALPDGPVGAEAALGLAAAALPGWEISLDGRASLEHGDWTCTLRRNQARDSDEVIGIGHGARPAPALLAALLRALAAGARP